MAITSYPERMVPPHLSVALPFQFIKVKITPVCVFFQPPSHFFGKNHNHSHIHTNVKEKRLLLAPAHTVRWCLMKTFGHCWTLVSGQAVDTCCQELNGTPPCSRDRRSEGQLHQYSLLTSPLDPWRTLSLCTLAIRVKVLSSPAYIMCTGRQTMARETGSETSSTDCSLDGSQWRWATAGLARLKLAFSLKLQGTTLVPWVRIYCRELDGSGPCCGLSLASRQSYQFKINLSFWLLWITFATTWICPCCSKMSPAVGRASVKEHLHNGSQWCKVRELHGIIYSHSGVVCKLWTRHTTPKCLSPCFLKRLSRKQIRCSNFGFDLMWKWAKHSNSLCALKVIYTDIFNTYIALARPSQLLLPLYWGLQKIVINANEFIRFYKAGVWGPAGCQQTVTKKKNEAKNEKWGKCHEIKSKNTEYRIKQQKQKKLQQWNLTHCTMQCTI